MKRMNELLVRGFVTIQSGKAHCNPEKLKSDLKKSLVLYYLGLLWGVCITLVISVIASILSNSVGWGILVFAFGLLGLCMVKGFEDNLRVMGELIYPMFLRHQRNIEKEIGAKVIDDTQLVMDITTTLFNKYIAIWTTGSASLLSNYILCYN